MDIQEPYQETVEHTMFIILGRMYETKTDYITSQHYNNLPDAYKHSLKDAMRGLLHEQWVEGELREYQSDPDPIYDILNARMTQKGKEWYQEQVINHEPKWKKLFRFVGELAIDAAIKKIP